MAQYLQDCLAQQIFRARGAPYISSSSITSSSLNKQVLFRVASVSKVQSTTSLSFHPNHYHFNTSATRAYKKRHQYKTSFRRMLPYSNSVRCVPLTHLSTSFAAMYESCGPSNCTTCPRSCGPSRSITDHYYSSVSDTSDLSEYLNSPASDSNDCESSDSSSSSEDEYDSDSNHDEVYLYLHTRCLECLRRNCQYNIEVCCRCDPCCGNCARGGDCDCWDCTLN